MTWAKKLDSRAYDPIAVVSVTPNAGSVSGTTVVEAYYTVTNDYVCQFNLRVDFTQNTADASYYDITSPLPVLNGTNTPVGNGIVYVSSFRSIWVQAVSATLLRAYLTGASTVASGSNVALAITGQFAIR